MEMRLASAGMPGPLHFSGSGCSVLNVSGIPPGLFADADYDTLTVRLEPGDCVMLCSDGIIEAQNARFEDFGIERLLAICGARGGLSPEELLRQIFLAVHISLTSSSNTTIWPLPSRNCSPERKATLRRPDGCNCETAGPFQLTLGAVSRNNGR
jgi:hypothetical protein